MNLITKVAGKVGANLIKAGEKIEKLEAEIRRATESDAARYDRAISTIELPTNDPNVADFNKKNREHFLVHASKVREAAINAEKELNAHLNDIVEKTKELQVSIARKDEPRVIAQSIVKLGNWLTKQGENYGGNQSS